MYAPMFVRPLTKEERERLQAALHSSDSFVLRRCQILLASSQGQKPAQIAQSVGRTPQTVRNVIQAFERQGLACLNKQSTRPKRLRTVIDAAGREALRELLHQSPRTFNQPTSLWTLPLAAQVSFEQGLIPLATAHPDWVLGFLDECWWSRLALPSLHSWAEEGAPLRRVEKHRDKQ